MVSHRTMQNASAVIHTTSAAVLEVLGTKVTVDTPLMSAGLDSIAVTDLVNVLSKRFEVELPPTLLFDHPTIESVATHITTLLPMEISEEVGLRDEYYSADEAIDEAPNSLWDLYSELKQEKADKLFLPPSARSARRAVVLLASAGSGSQHILSTLSAHQHLCVCEDLCLVPFKTVPERNEVLSRRDNLKDGLDDAVKTLRNCKMPDICHLFGTVASTYRTLQEWCAPRVLVDGTEAYAAMPQWSLTEANNVFLNPDIVHLLRNPRECLGNAQVSLSCDIEELEK
jgi:acyl carrier protein